MTESTSAPKSSANAELAIELAGKYMTFKLADAEYGIEILSVREIIELMDITRVPRTPPFIRGVINLRGKVHAVIDLRLKFGMDAAEPTDQTVIIVVQQVVAGQNITMGVMVDEVVEVLDVAESQIEPAPTMGNTAGETAFLLGIGKSGSRVIFLLDIAKVISADDASQILRAAGPT